MPIRDSVLCCALLLPVAGAAAVCLDGRRPSPGEEFGASHAVVVGHVTGHTDLMEDSSDPAGITATLYRVKVLRRLRGAVESSLLLRSENTSSRFPLETGEDYLLFLNKNGKTYSVDGCGNSTQKSNAASVISGLPTENRSP